MLLQVLLLSVCLIVSSSSQSLPDGSADFVKQMGLKDLKKGSKPVSGLCHPNAYELDGSQVPRVHTSRLFPKGINTTKFSIVTTVKLEKGSKGYLFMINPEKPVLALRTDPSTDEPLILEFDGGYLDLGVDIADGNWHVVSIAIGEKNVELLIDCRSANNLGRPEKLKIDKLPSGLTVLGSLRAENERFKGTIQELSIVPGDEMFAIGYCNERPECQNLVTKNVREQEPVEVQTKPSFENVGAAETKIPEEFVVVDGSTYYVSVKEVVK